MLSYKKLFFISIITLWSFINGETTKDILNISPFNCLETSLQENLKTVTRKEPFVDDVKCEEECQLKAKIAVILMNDVFTKSLNKIKINLKLNIKGEDKIEIKFKPEIEYRKMIDPRLKKNLCVCSTKNLGIFGTKSAKSIIIAITKEQDFKLAVEAGKILEHEKFKNCIVDLKGKPKISLIDKLGPNFKKNSKKSLTNKSGKIVIKPKITTKLGSQHRLRKRSNIGGKLAEGIRNYVKIVIKLLIVYILSVFLLHCSLNKIEIFKSTFESMNERGVNPLYWIMAFLYVLPHP